MKPTNMTVAAMNNIVANSSTLPQSTIVNTASDPSSTHGGEIGVDKQRSDSPSDSPILPKRQARMALNAITHRRKYSAMPRLQRSEGNGAIEKNVSSPSKDENNANSGSGTSVHTKDSSADNAISPKLPPPNKRKTSILKDGIYAKLGDKNVTINEVTNTKHHYDPLEYLNKAKSKQNGTDTKQETDKIGERGN